MRTFCWGIVALIFAAVPAYSAELWMFEEKHCSWCQRWHAEIGPIYPKTSEGKRAPLRTVNLHGEWPEEVELTSRPRFTPTFVLIDDGREVARLEGYPGEDFFWGLLANMIKKLPTQDDPQT